MLRGVSVSELAGFTVHGSSPFSMGWARGAALLNVPGLVGKRFDASVPPLMYGFSPCWKCFPSWLWRSGWRWREQKVTLGLKNVLLFFLQVEIQNFRAAQHKVMVGLQFGDSVAAKRHSVIVQLVFQLLNPGISSWKSAWFGWAALWEFIKRL